MNEHVFKLFIAEDFAKALQDEFTIYAFIMINIIKESIIEHQVKTMNNAMSCITNAFKMQILFIELKKYEDVFFFKFYVLMQSKTMKHDAIYLNSSTEALCVC